MPRTSSSRPATSPRDGLAGRLRRLLDAAGYSEGGVDEALGLHGALSLAAAEAPLHLRRLGENGPDRLSTLIALFLLGGSVELEDAARSLRPLKLAELEEAGLLERGGERVRSPVRVVPWEGLLVAHDREDVPLERDHVAGIGPAARTLAALTVRLPVERALDLGAGCGVQALLAARHASRVVAADVNPRALRYTELNSELNGLTNVECREGSLFEPVRGLAFDLVVANPPFVISPDVEYVFRDSGEPGDAISRTVVSEVPGFLRRGGYAHVLCNWVCRPGEDWSEDPRSWIEGSGCDAWLLHYQTEDPLGYAVKWNEQLRARDSASFARTLERWLDYYRAEGIEAIATGAVVLRRREGRNWVRADEMPLGPSGSASSHVLRVFEAQDYLGTVEDERELLGEVFRPVERHRLDQTLLYRDGEYAIQDARLLLEDGVGLAASVSPRAVHVLFRLDGERPLGELIAEAAAETGMEAESLGSEALEEVRRLFELGLLLRESRQ